MKVRKMDDKEIFESEGLVNMILNLATLPDPRMVPKEVLQKSIDNAKNSILRAIARAREEGEKKGYNKCLHDAEYIPAREEKARQQERERIFGAIENYVQQRCVALKEWEELRAKLNEEKKCSK